MNNVNKDRYEDIGIPTYYWENEIEVNCPQCLAQALVEKIEERKEKREKEIRFTCFHCGKHEQFIEEKEIFYKHGKQGVDPFLGYSLYLKEETPYGSLWVYNADHLAHLKAYIEAKERVKTYADRYFSYYMSYFHKLPLWVKSAKNRTMILRKIATLEAKATTKKTNKTPLNIAKEEEESFYYRKRSRAWESKDIFGEEERVIYYFNYDKHLLKPIKKILESHQLQYVINLNGGNFSTKELLVNIAEMELEEETKISDEMISFERGDYVVLFGDSAFSDFQFGFTEGVMKKIRALIVND